MKRNALPFVFFTVLFSGAGVYAQELSQTAVPKDAYNSNPKAGELINQRKVREAFQHLQSVYTLDFPAAVPEKVVNELTGVTQQTISQAGFVDYNNRKTISDLLVIQPEALTVRLPFKGTVIVVDLVKADLFGDGFVVNGNEPAKVANLQTGLYYQGTVRGKTAVVTFSFFQDEFSALITTEDVSNSVIEAGFVRTPGNTSGTHVIYSDDDLKISLGHPCMAESLEQYGMALEKLKKEPVTPAEEEKVLLKCVTYFWETSYNMYQQFGTTAAVTNYMTSLFNNFQVIYANESIGAKLNQLYIWTTADSYADNLNTFSSSRTGFAANLATLFSTTGGGGVAWVDVLCGTGSDYYKHAFCGSVGGSFSAVPNYSWPVNVSTHEVGHNLGSPHTHACTWTGGAIDGCGPAAGYSEGCTGPIPTGGGTIMSYCHLLSTGINFNLGFGPQPGTLIRSRVNSCITLTCESSGNSNCAGSYEPNETQAAAATIGAGPAITAAISTSTDVDYFKIVIGTTTNNTFSLVGPSGVDFDLVVYNSGGTQIGSSTSGTATETVSLTNQAAGTYYAKVFGYNGANSATCYSFQVSAVSTSCSSAYEANETQAAAAAIPLNSTIYAAVTTATDVDFFKVTTTATANNTYTLAGPAGVDFDLYVYNSAGTQLGSSTSTTANETVTLNAQAAGTYSVKVFGYNGALSATCYTLTVGSTNVDIMAPGDAAAIHTESLTIYPNPTTDKLYIGNGSFTGRLINQLGQTVLTFEGSELSLKELQSGVYLLQVDGSPTLYRVMKE